MENLALTTTKPAGLQRADLPLPEQWAAALALDVRAGVISQATADTYRRGLGKFIAWGESNPERVTEHAVKEWLASLRSAGISQNAISVWFAGVRAFFAWAVSEKKLPNDPTSGVKRGKRTGTAQSHKREMLTDDEML